MYDAVQDYGQTLLDILCRNPVEIPCALGVKIYGDIGFAHIAAYLDLCIFQGLAGEEGLLLEQVRCLDLFFPLLIIFGAVHNDATRRRAIS